MRYIFDLETNGLLDEVTKIHCIVAANLTTRKLQKFSTEAGNIEEGLQLLADAEELIGHNIMGYDLMVIKKLYPTWHTTAKLTDTLIQCRLIWGNIGEIDSDNQTLPSKLRGRHSLEAWGYRLKCLKGDYGVTADWETYTKEMLQYCVQDVLVNNKLYDKIISMNYSQDAMDLEHEIHRICLEQEHFGFPFNEDKAVALYAKLSARRDELKQLMIDTFEPNIIVLKTKTKTLPFNPTSRQQIADRLQRRGWKPKAFTESGQVIVNETTLKEIEKTIPEAALLLEYLMLVKRVGQLAEGKNGWLKLSKNGRIHYNTNTLGAITGRATASRPNVQQVPSVRAEYGKECRELFYAPKGWELMGSDQSGIELRCLASYMSKWDKGEYAKIILDGDIHTTNMEALGLTDRGIAKTWAYGFLYGAGVEKLGNRVGKGRKEGSRLKTKFLNALPALKGLQDDVKEQAEQGTVNGLDGRVIPVRHAHASLNTLLQSCGAILSKRWVVTFHQLCKENGYTHGVEFQQCAWVHDEIQILVKEGTGDVFGNLAQKAMRLTGDYYKFGVRLDAEYNIGRSWADTH